MVAPLVDNLTPKQELAITALLTETTVERAAKAAGVATRTLYNWLDKLWRLSRFLGLRSSADRPRRRRK